MRLLSTFVAATLLLISGTGVAQEIEEPFKVGTFEMGGSPQIGIVLRDSLIVELNPANAALEKGGRHPELAMPSHPRFVTK